jgi:hypothetical protein
LTGTVNASHEVLVDLVGSVSGSQTKNADMLIEGAGVFGINGTLYLEAGSRVDGNFINNGRLISRDIADINVWIGGASIGVHQQRPDREDGGQEPGDPLHGDLQFDADPGLAQQKSTVRPGVPPMFRSLSRLDDHGQSCAAGPFFR